MSAVCPSMPRMLTLMSGLASSSRTMEPWFSCTAMMRGVLPAQNYDDGDNDINLCSPFE